MPKSKTSRVAETKAVTTPEPEAKKAPAKAVKAVFVPVGQVTVHLETPRGNEYTLVPREEFTIAAEDVEWFFYDWDYGFRQRLILAADYKPTCGYHDPKAGEKDYHPTMEYSDPIVADAKTTEAPVMAKKPTEAPVEVEVEAPAAADANTDSGDKE